ncbi:DNA primase [Tenacibaculum soleae]|uniref:DNA primase n=1 Tax=Tenacibaculum soleae TaxID=447689 RepID=UPI002301699B|nr:DNA primase [Tenacibaculum soleae]
MPYIQKDFAESLLEKVDITDVISDYTELKKKGAHYFGLSPFQKEKSPSFCVNKIKQRYNCYSSGKSGNVISFLMDHENMSYPEALESLAKKYGIPVAYENKEQAAAYVKQQQKKENIRPILDASLLHYQKAFVQLADNHPAKADVIDKRHYTKEVILDWQIGFAPGQRFLTDKLKDVNLLEQAQEIALVGDKADKYWNRVIYPIHDVKGMLVGFAGRDVSGEEQAAKWINPSESIIYHKDKTWFGLHRALREIIKTGEANIVEGYNDVIAWHENGLLNTVAPCGTAITETQIQILSKYCKRINFTFDDDGPGKKAMLRYIPIFLAAGFRVNVQKTAGLDPDDFVREYKDDILEQEDFFKVVTQTENKEEAFAKGADCHLSEEEITEILESKLTSQKYALEKVVLAVGEKIDGFKILLQEHLQGNAVAKSDGAYKLCEIIAQIPDEPLKEIYIPWLKTESKVSISSIKKWVKQAEAKLEAAAAEKAAKKTKKNTDFDVAELNYTLPDEVTVEFKDVKADIFTYGLFIANNKVWMQTGTDGEYSFKAVTNFSIEIIQHMQDEKFPMKLLRIKNVFGLEKIFDVPSENINTVQRFDTSVTNYGNFLWTGDSREFLKLKGYLFNKMGTGRKIDVLGHQPEGFWVWNNLVILANQEQVTIDDNGLFIHEDISFYIPSANSIYAKNPFKYEPQKKFRVQQAKVNFHTFVAKAIQVHRDHAISAILFAVSSLFQDIVVSELGNFPIFYMYGPASTGKDQLAEIMQSFFGVPQTPINLEGGASTLKAKVLELAQFTNSMSHFSEYKRGDVNVNGILKGFWDRNGYKRGNIVSHIGTESIPILSSVILTGNDYPDAEALITRLFWNEMTKNEFSEEEVKNFDELRDMTTSGISSYSLDILKHREHFKANFQQKYRMFKGTFNEQVADARSRMVSNVSVLGATYEILKDKIDFPFTFNEMVNHFKRCTEQQVRKLNSESVTNKWWDCFLASLRSPIQDRLQVGVDFKLDGTHLFFTFTNVYNKIQRQWWTQFHEAIPGKSVMKDQMQKSAEFVFSHAKGIRMSPGAGNSSTSAFEMDIKNMSIYDDIFNAIQYQLSAKDSISFPPATPLEKNNSENSASENSDFFSEILPNDES